MSIHARVMAGSLRWLSIGFLVLSAVSLFAQESDHSVA